MTWENVVQRVAPYVVKIETPSGHGTGYLCAQSEGRDFCAVATALHVVRYANQWQQPMRIYNHDLSKSVFLRETDRLVIHGQQTNTDSAAIIFNSRQLELPDEIIPFRPIEPPLGIGVKVGWLGFPALDPETLCFFSGDISARKPTWRIYLIDGVAINGVSGGPVVCRSDDRGIEFVGVVSAYQANRMISGETLPGLLIANDVSDFHVFVQGIKNLDEFKRRRAELQRQADKPTD